MNDTPRTNMNRGYAATIKGINTTDYLVCDQNGPFVLAQCAEELERENTRLSEGFAPAINAIEVNACANEEAANRATEPRDIAWSQGVAAGLRLALSYLPNAMMSHGASDSKKP